MLRITVKPSPEGLNTAEKDKSKWLNMSLQTLSLICVDMKIYEDILNPRSFEVYSSKDSLLSK